MFLEAPAPGTKEAKDKPGVAATVSCAGSLDTALRSVASAAGLLSAPSPVVREGAGQLVAVETQRAMRLLNALRILSGEIVLRRAAVRVSDLLENVRSSFEREFRVCGVERSLRVSADPTLTVYGSEELLRTAVAGVVTALGLAETYSEPRQFEIVATAGSGGDASVSIDMRERGVSIPKRWMDHVFDEPWPVSDGGTALVFFQAARAIAGLHSSALVIDASTDSTRVRLTLPSA
jgi:nitrogen-specific signal transduction histidine kinase